MDREDDPKISGDLVFYRRIPPWGNRVTWDADGPNFSSMNFKDKDDELSVHLAAETTPDEVLAGHAGFGLVQLTAAVVRDACGEAVKLCRCPDDPAMGHVLICGKITGGMAKKLQRAATWVAGRWPSREQAVPPPEPPDGSSPPPPPAE